MSPTLLPMPATARREAWEGCSVILEFEDSDRPPSFAHLTSGATVEIDGRRCSLQPLVGCPFGSIFRVEPCSGEAVTTGRLVPFADAPSTDDHTLQYDGVQVEIRDNRSLVDNNRAQALSGDDIEAMKRDGGNGDAIVEALIANSSTFGKKTVHAQEKYKLKKRKKHAHRLLLRRPSARSLCEAFFKKTPEKIGFMRVDVMSLLLSMANVGAYSDVLVVDMVGGLVVGAVAERLGGTGYVCSTYIGSSPSSIDIIRMYNLSSEITSRIVQAPFSDLCLLTSTSELNGSTLGEVVEPSIVSNKSYQLSAAEQVDAKVADEHAQSSTSKPVDVEVCDTSIYEHPKQDGTYFVDCTGRDGTSSASKSLKAERAPSSARIKYWNEHGFNSFIIAAPEHEVETFVGGLLPLLSHSAPFAIYHQYLQPLATCMHFLQASKMAIGLHISEPWLREYQVLPSRTHPDMKMNASGGYILSGNRT